MNNNLIIENIMKERRLEMGLSMRQLAKLIGINHSEISRLENGKKEKINLSLLFKLCDILQLDYQEIISLSRYLNNKKYKVSIKRNIEQNFEIEALNEKEAINVVSEYLNKNKFDNIEEEKISFEIVEIIK